MDFKDMMIEAMDRGVHPDEAYDHVRETLADVADRRREDDFERSILSSEKEEGEEVKS